MLSHSTMIQISSVHVVNKDPVDFVPVIFGPYMELSRWRIRGRRQCKLKESRFSPGFIGIGKPPEGRKEYIEGFLPHLFETRNLCAATGGPEVGFGKGHRRPYVGSVDNEDTYAEVLLLCS